MDFPLQSREPFDRVRLLRDQSVDTLICGGMQDVYEDVLRASGFEVISWVSGSGGGPPGHVPAGAPGPRHRAPATRARCGHSRQLTALTEH